MTLPVILYNVDNKKIDSNIIIIPSLTYFFYSHEIIKAKVIDGPGILFSVIEQNGGLVASSDYEYNNNTGYTLYCNGADTTVAVTNSYGVTEKFKFIYRPENILTEEQEHYNDLIINHYLPTFEELEPALVPGTPKADLLKRLLLDFRNIMQSKGTKASIEKFFYFIGFNYEQIRVLDEYHKNGTQPDDDSTQDELLSWIGNKNITTNPDTTVDTKTGNYHVLFDNWDDGTLNGKQDVNRKNMPYRPFAQQDFDKFFQALKYAISLANKYFTLVEQEITFFGISFSTNIPMYQSVTSYFNKIFVTDLNQFRKRLHIDLYYNYVSAGYEKVPNYLVKNTLQKQNKAYRSETKFIESDINHNSELYIVAKEIADNETLTDSSLIELYRRLFGVVLHTTVHAPNLWLQVTIENIYNPLVKIVIPKQYVTDSVHIEYFTAIASEYKITYEFWDEYNSYEKYFYNYLIEDDVRLLDVDIFTSSKILDENFDKSHINLDVDSGSIITKEINDLQNYILPVNEIPYDLRRYYALDQNISRAKFLSTTNITKDKKLYLLPEINKNYKVNSVTDTIPVTHTDQWLEFTVIPYIDASLLYVRTYDADNREYKVSKLINENWELDPTFNKLFVRKMNIHETYIDSDSDTLPTDTIPYIFICPIETGINMCKDTFDIVVKSGDDNYTSIYENKQQVTKQIPVNFDFPLFPILANDDNFIYSCITDTYPIVKSLFPRLQQNKFAMLKLGDVILCRLNADRVCAETDIKWSILNEFDGKVLFTTTDYALKYRLSKNTIYTIQCEFMANEKPFKIIRTGVISSWTL